MEVGELGKIVAHYRLLAEQSDMISEQQAFRYRNFASVIETNSEFLEEVETEEELWEFYNEQSSDGWLLMNPEDDS